uniref:Metalloendopeptidase n=1 Tax=Angiostrongylus cantonensis TaxID=6313 RepID=A0A0K0DHD2_ANGCA
MLSKTSQRHHGADEVYGKHIPVEVVNDFRSDIRKPSTSQKRSKRNGVSRVAKLWPGARIPYAISPHYTPYERALLARAVKQYHEKTCIRFVPRSGGEPDYLFIGKVDGCFSEVGRTSGVQVLSLDNGCMEYATIIHEMMHVIGFYHEHERWDRDNFIDIIWQNIDRGALDQFGKVDLSKTSYYGQPYDYKSILHYDSLAFSKNGFPTMLPKQKSATIGNAKDFSDVDLAKINRMYSCPVENKQQTAPFARASHSSSDVFFQHSPLYVALNKYDDRTKVPSRYYDSQQNPYSGNKPERNAIFEAVFFFSAFLNSKNNVLLWCETRDCSGCEDKITVCWWTADRCRASAIHTMMLSLCSKTCGFC